MSSVTIVEKRNGLTALSSETLQNMVHWDITICFNMTVAYTKFFMLCKFGEDVGGIYYSFSIIGSHIHFRCPFWTAYSRWRCDRASASSWLQGSSVETSHSSPVQSTLFSWVLKNWIFGPRGNLTKCAAQNENNDGRVSFRNWVQGRCIQNKWIINARVYETHYYRDYQQI